MLLLGSRHRTADKPYRHGLGNMAALSVKDDIDKNIIMRKCNLHICEQRRLRSVCAYAQSDLSLPCSQISTIFGALVDPGALKETTNQTD